MISKYLKIGEWATARFAIVRGLAWPGLADTYLQYPYSARHL